VLRGITGDERIVDSIRLRLAKEFGVTASRAIDFYADAHIALASPEEYAMILLDIFGRGASQILETIILGLGDEFGFETSEATTLGDCIGALQAAKAEDPALR